MTRPGTSCSWAARPRPTGACAPGGWTGGRTRRCSIAELGAVVDRYTTAKPRIMVTHTAPSAAAETVFPEARLFRPLSADGAGVRRDARAPPAGSLDLRPLAPLGGRRRGRHAVPVPGRAPVLFADPPRGPAARAARRRGADLRRISRAPRLLKPETALSAAAQRASALTRRYPSMKRSVSCAIPDSRVPRAAAGQKRHHRGGVLRQIELRHRRVEPGGPGRRHGNRVVPRGHQDAVHHKPGGPLVAVEVELVERAR